MIKKIYLLSFSLGLVMLHAPSQGSLVETEHSVKFSHVYSTNYYVADYPEITLDSPIFKKATYIDYSKKFESEDDALKSVETYLQDSQTLIDFKYCSYKDEHSNHYVLANKYVVWTHNRYFLPNDLTDKSLKGVLHYFGTTTFKGKPIIDENGIHSGLYQLYNPQVGLVYFKLMPVYLGGEEAAPALASNAAAGSSPAVEYDSEEEQEDPTLE